MDLVSKTWWTNADGRTDAAGVFQTRGFFGDYDVTVSRGGQSKTVRIHLLPGQTQQQVLMP